MNDEDFIAAMKDAGLGRFKREANADDLVKAAKKGDTKTVKLLLNYGVGKNSRNKYGYTALIVASCRGHTEVVKLLLKSGVDINAEDKTGSTALMWASIWDRTEVVKLLKQHGAKE